jgi:hypothetical protein
MTGCVAVLWALLTLGQPDQERPVDEAWERLRLAHVSVFDSVYPCDTWLARCVEVPRDWRVRQADQKAARKYSCVRIPIVDLPDFLSDGRELACATSESRRAYFVDDLGVFILRGTMLRLTADYRLEHLVRDVLQLPMEVSSISCPFTGLNDSQLGEFAARFKSLNGLELGGNPLTDAGLQRLSDLQSLRALDVSDTRITGEGLAKLHCLPALTSLSVGGCVLSDSEVAEIVRRAANLELAFLHYTSCGTATASQLASHKRLRVVDLAHTKMDDAAVNSLWQLASLEEIYLDDLPLTDAAFADVERAKHLKSVSLHGTTVSEDLIRRLRSRRIEVVVNDELASESLLERIRFLEKLGAGKD